LITPDLPKNNDIITVNAFGSVDIDNDSLTYIFEWYKNSAFYFTDTDLTAPYSSVISADSTADNDVFYCIVRTRDIYGGFSTSIQSNSAKVTDKC